MFFGNPELLERNLHTDLNTLIKNVKARQDQYLTLLQYNKNLIGNLSQIQNMSFITDIINMQKSFLNSSQAAHQKILVEEQEIKQKYVCAVSSEVGIAKLMGRVISRVLQICQASCDKGKTLDPILSEKFIAFKNMLLDNLSQGSKINIQLILETVIQYIVSKNLKQVQRLQDIIKILINGQFQKLNEVYALPKVQQKRPPSPKKQLHKKPVIDKQKQKQQKIRKEQQAKNIQKTKKKKTKIAKQLVTSIYSTMDLSKQQLMEDMNYTSNPEQKRKRLYQQIFSRNKFNYEQILQFQSKKEQFQQKVKQFKQMMEEESRRIQHALVVVIPKVGQHKQHKSMVKQTPRKQTKSQAGDNQQDLEPIQPQRLAKVFRRRQNKQPQKAQSPKFVKQIAFSAMQSTQQGFQHIKFDLRNQQIFTRSNRAKLPQLPARSSLDNKYEGKSLRAGSEKKQQKRINIMKNIEIGMVNTQMSKNIPILNQNKKSPRDRNNADPIFENVANVHQDAIGTSGLDYTFYVRKKVTKFYQTKTNFIL